MLQSLDRPIGRAQTIAPAWKVKDVAAHLLDTQLRKLSRRARRLRRRPAAAIHVDATIFVAFINRLNREGVEMYRRLSPAVLISMMEVASRESAEFHQSLDPMADAAFSVSWAGEEKSLNWFDTARELTERWHHQQQIRLATNRPGIMTRELYYPVLDCFMRALPFTYRDQSAEPGTHVRFNVSGDCGGSWYLYRDGERWVLVETPQGGRSLRRRFRRTSPGASLRRESIATRRGAGDGQRRSRAWLHVLSMVVDHRVTLLRPGRIA